MLADLHALRFPLHRSCENRRYSGDNTTITALPNKTRPTLLSGLIILRSWGDSLDVFVGENLIFRDGQKTVLSNFLVLVIAEAIFSVLHPRFGGYSHNSLKRQHYRWKGCV